MSHSFDPTQGLVVVEAEIEGPSGNAIVRLALDTGATVSLINAALLTAIGYDPALSPKRVQVTTGSGIEFVPEVEISRIKAMGQERICFPLLCHTLPTSTGVDGLLGLDFLRGFHLAIDFRSGRIDLR